MKAILDTNVFVSGVFFGGTPSLILEAWRDRKISLVISPEILDEYSDVAEELAIQFPDVDAGPTIDLLAITASIIDAPSLEEQVCTDRDDDMFLACALASDTKVVVSGDKALLKTSGYKGVEVMTPRAFVDRYL